MKETEKDVKLKETGRKKISGCHSLNLERADYLSDQDRRHWNPIICKRAQSSEFRSVDLTCFSSLLDRHHQLVLVENIKWSKWSPTRVKLCVVSWSSAQAAGPTATDRVAPHPRRGGIGGLGERWGVGGEASHQFAGPGIAASPAT